jgi:hypothetical protein
VVVYHDPYSSFFWWYLLDRSLDQQAMWAYHHRRDMDDARYRALLAKSAGLEAKVRQLEKDGVERDSGYTLPGVDPDLQYSDEFVEAAYNPEHGGHGAWKVLLFVLIGITFFAGCVYLMFFKRW